MELFIIIAVFVVVAIVDFLVIKVRQNKAEKRKQVKREEEKRKWDEEKSRETAKIGTQNEPINQNKNKKVVSANNLIAKLNISYVDQEKIINIMRTKENTLLTICELINKYFKEEKRNNLGSIAFGTELVFQIMFASANKQDSYDQAALYCSLYPEPFSRLSKDIEEYFDVAGVTEAIEQIKKRSKETDGPYEDMLRRQGLTNSIEYVKCVGCTNFQDCTKRLIGPGVKKLNMGAFFGCKSLKEITIPESVTEIGCQAFRWCKSLEKITIPKGVTGIGDAAFLGCESLKEVTIYNSVTRIGTYAFRACKSLEKITIPESVTEMGEHVFLCCRNLKEIILPRHLDGVDGEYLGVQSTVKVTRSD